MIKTISLILFASVVSQAAVHSFIPCIAQEGQSTLKKVRELLAEPVKVGNAHIVGYYELKKNNQVVGYLPFFYDHSKQVLSEAYLCSTSWDDYYYLNGASSDIKNWMPKINEIIVLKGLVNDEAVSNLRLTKVNNSEVKVDFFIRSLGGGNEIIKDIAILNLKPKKDL